MKYYLGIDIGGTKCAVIRGDETGRVLSKVRFATADCASTVARILDEALQQINSDYEAKRYKDITLQRLQIIKARPHLFEDWLKGKGKLGGQHKVPRLSNQRQYIDEMLQMNM